MVYKTMVIFILLGRLHFMSLFSIRPAIGMRTRIIVKYEIDATCPMIMNGCSTGWPPIHVRIIRLAARSQNRHWLIGRNIRLRCFAVCSKGMMARTRIEQTRANTPPSLFGIDRRIA